MNTKPTLYEKFLIVDCYYQRLILDPGNTSAYAAIEEEAIIHKNIWAMVRMAEIDVTCLLDSNKNAVLIQRGITALEKLSKQGFSFAQFKLAQSYKKLEIKPTAVTKLLKSCIKARIPDAAVMLSTIYENTKPNKSKKLLSLAIQWGYIQEDTLDPAKITKAVTQKTDDQYEWNCNNEAEEPVYIFNWSRKGTKQAKKKKNK